MIRKLVVVMACALSTVAWQSALAATALDAADGNQLQVFPFPQPYRYTHHNDDFTVRVRVPGGDWQDLYEYK